MDINEAIQHCKEKAIENSCSQCGKDHEQLANWLVELKWYRDKSIKEHDEKRLLMKSKVYRLKEEWKGSAYFPKRGLVVSVSTGDSFAWCIPLSEYHDNWMFYDYVDKPIQQINLDLLEEVTDAAMEMKRSNLDSCNVVFFLDRELTNAELELTEQLLLSLDADEVKSTHDRASHDIRVDYDRFHPKYIVVKRHKEIAMKGFTVQESLDIYTKIINNL